MDLRQERTGAPQRSGCAPSSHHAAMVDPGTADARPLLGGVASSTFYDYKRDPDRVLDQDKLTRISYLVGIFKALNILHGEDLADQWVSHAQSQPDFRRQIAARLHGCRRCPGHADGAAPAGRPPGRRVRRRRISSIGAAGHPPADPLEIRRERAARWSPTTTGLAQDIFDLDHATNERLIAENDLLPGIGIRELVLRRAALPHRQCRLLPCASARQPFRQAPIAASGTPASSLRRPRPR